MSPLSWFRFQASGREFLGYSVAAALLVWCLVSIKSSIAEDYDGDGWDDDTGEWVGGTIDDDFYSDGTSKFREYTPNGP